jgi:hypothetical protein
MKDQPGKKQEKKHWMLTNYNQTKGLEKKMSMSNHFYKMLFA